MQDLGVWVGEGLKKEIAGERGPRRPSQRRYDEKLWESFRSIPPAVLWFTYIKGVAVVGTLSVSMRPKDQADRKNAAKALEGIYMHDPRASLN